jgi:hypothetical protein
VTGCVMVFVCPDGLFVVAHGMLVVLSTMLPVVNPVQVSASFCFACAEFLGGDEAAQSVGEHEH